MAPAFGLVGLVLVVGFDVGCGLYVGVVIFVRDCHFGIDCELL